MSIPICQSSAREYVRKWQHFLPFLESSARFGMSMLFDMQGLLASTVAHYRAALSVPWRIILNVSILALLYMDTLTLAALFILLCNGFASRH